MFKIIDITMVRHNMFITTDKGRIRLGIDVGGEREFLAEEGVAKFNNYVICELLRDVLNMGNEPLSHFHVDLYAYEKEYDGFTHYGFFSRNR